MNDLHQRGRHVFAVKGVVVGKQLVQHNPSRKDIGPRIYRTAIDLLGRHVAHAAHDLSGSGFFGSANVGDTEIHDLDRAIFRNHDVGRLDIAMHNAAVVSVTQTVADANNGLDFFEDTELPAGRNDGIEALALQELHHKIRISRVVPQFEDGDDIGMLQAAGGLGLAKEAL